MSCLSSGKGLNSRILPLELLRDLGVLNALHHRKEKRRVGIRLIGRLGKVAEDTPVPSDCLIKDLDAVA